MNILHSGRTRIASASTERAHLKTFSISFLLWVLLLPSSTHAAWLPVGPFGGDVRSLVADPSDPTRLYIGTRTGQIYLSTDSGKQWNRLTNLDAPSDWVVDDLVIDPANTNILYAGMWSVRDNGGGIFKSADRGASWILLDGLKNQFVRAVALSPSNTQIVIAATRQGVFRSDDAGANWKQISPLNHPEIRNLESIAIDPLRPEIIYAGTWHLPWKSTDGGATWFSIKKGMIDDSDVFSVIVDYSSNRTLYATACSGIYRSDSAGGEWIKIQGIPNTARRTHTLVLDPQNPRILYAGTTEGLWRTADRGQSWQQLTPPAWVINAVHIDPENSRRILLGTDHAGVMESRDGGRTFQPLNQGFSQRQISRLVADPARDGRYYVALLHDRDFGGVYVTDNRGASWQRLGEGLRNLDILSLLVLPQRDSNQNSRLIAGTTDGLFEYSVAQGAWKKTGQWASPQINTQKPAKRGNAKPAPTARTAPLIVHDLFQRAQGEPVYAATSFGLFRSDDAVRWQPVPSQGVWGQFFRVRTLDREGKFLMVASSNTLSASWDGGLSWNPVYLDGSGPLKVQQITFSPGNPQVIFAGSDRGLFSSSNGGQSWEKFGRGVPLSSINDIAISPSNPQHVIVVSSSGIFQSIDGGNRYQRLDVVPDGLPVERMAFPSNGSLELMATSANNGVFVFHDRSLLLTELLQPDR